jgi:2'-5' RNA ligase
VRLFIAIPLPTAVAQRASRLLPETLPGLRRVRAENLHVTLAFLGWTPDDRLADVLAAAADAARVVERFDFVIDGAGTFPERGRPRVVWLGIGEGFASVVALSEALAAALKRRALRFDERPLSPHLTLARVRDEARLAEARTVAAAVADLVVPRIRVAVGEIAVVRSVLSPKGPTYTPERVLPVGANRAERTV